MDRAYTGGACTDGTYNIIYSKSPISPGNGGFVYIESPIKILLSLQKAKNLLVLI